MRKLYLYALSGISLIFAIFQGCVTLPSNPTMPQWDVDLNVPFASKSYILNDIIKSQNYISISASQDSVYLINSDQYNQSVGISNFITVSLQSGTASSIQVPDSGGTEVYIAFPEGAKIYSASFQAGTLKIVGHNTKSVPASLHITVPGILKPDNSKLDLIVNVPANSNNTVQVNLAGYTYQQPANQLFLFPGQLWIQAAMNGIASGNGIVSFDSYVSDFIFNSVYGYLPPKSLGTKSDNFTLDLGDATKYRDKVFLKTATLTLTGQYKSPASNPFIVQINNLRMVGSRIGSKITKELTFNANATNTFRFDSTGKFTAVYNESNSNITDFITFLPDAINLSAEYFMNPDNNPTYKTATSSDTVKFTTNFATKSVLAIQQTSYSDTLKLDISQDSRDQIAKGKGVSASVDIQNAIPLNSWIKVTLVDQFYHKLFVLSKTATGRDSINFPGASVDANGNVTNPASSTTTIVLDSTQIRLLSNNAQYAIISVSVSTTGTNNSPVIVRAKDWIKLNSYGRITYRINNGDQK